MAEIGLVLGAGGVVGHAFHAGVLAAIADTTGWDARDATVVVGTSAGAVVGALLRADMSPADLAARSTGTPLSDAGNAIVARAESATSHLPPLPARSTRRRVPSMAAPGAFVRGALPPWTVRPGTLVAAALPAGQVPTELVSTTFVPLFDGWPDAALWINAVELDRGRRVTFGRDAQAPDVATAVGASCAIPSYFAPVVIDGVRYVDGGTHSPTNADLLAGLGLDLVVVSSPMSMARARVRIAPDHAARSLARLALAREVAKIRAAGTPVITFQPTASDLAQMGMNAMDEHRRAAVTIAARASARHRLVRADARERVARLVATRA